MRAIDKRKRIDFRTVHRVEETLRMSSELFQVISHMHSQEMIDPWSYEICRNTESLASAQIHLMCIFAIRFSEISQIYPLKLKHQEDFSVLQKKTGKMRVLQHPPTPKNFHYTFNSMTVNLELISYDGVKIAINRAVPQDLKNFLVDSHSSTHIFRHLRASWMHAQGIEKDIIREFFAHESIETTSEYIHTGLFPMS